MAPFKWHVSTAPGAVRVAQSPCSQGRFVAVGAPVVPLMPPPPAQPAPLLTQISVGPQNREYVTTAQAVPVTPHSIVAPPRVSRAPPTPHCPQSAPRHPHNPAKPPRVSVLARWLAAGQMRRTGGSATVFAPTSPTTPA